MNLFRSSGIIVLVILGLIVWSSTFIVDERKKALVLRFGESDVARIKDQADSPPEVLQDFPGAVGRGIIHYHDVRPYIPLR